MRKLAPILAAAAGLAGFALAANAAPVIPAPPSQPSNIEQAAWGCGWGLHPNRWGRCVPYRHGYYRPRHYWHRYSYRYWPRYHWGYYGGGYEPWNRPSPTDHIANQLNAREAGRLYYGY